MIKLAKAIEEYQEGSNGDRPMVVFTVDKKKSKLMVGLGCEPFEFSILLSIAMLKEPGIIGAVRASLGMVEEIDEDDELDVEITISSLVQALAMGEREFFARGMRGEFGSLDGGDGEDGDGEDGVGSLADYINKL